MTHAKFETVEGVNYHLEPLDGHQFQVGELLYTPGKGWWKIAEIVGERPPHMVYRLTPANKS